MKLTPRPHPGFWYIYSMINFSHAFTLVKRDYERGIETHIKLRGQKKRLRKHPLVRVLNGALWLLPAVLAIVFALAFPELTPWNYIFAILWVIAYHFAAMYYIIEVSDALKIECFTLDEYDAEKKLKKKTHQKKKK
ncbi:hypothetical protein LAT59_03265 [Candidatus Gracilibacteria bacterium]|nr:hypothetical protein [Candidatus Gracilibacteria bacterium]